MQGRIWVAMAVGVLIFLAWFMLEPGTFLASAPSVPVRPISEMETAKSRTFSMGPVLATQAPRRENPMEVAAQIETGSGKEVPGEKIISFSSVENYRKFLSLAPPGAVLGQLDVLKAVRAQTGAWLSEAMAQTGGVASGNFYIQIPEVPLEVRQKGDTLYQAVGKKALELIGAGGVTEAWGRGVKIALMDTPVDGVEGAEGETAGHGTAMRSLIVGVTGSARGAAPGAELAVFPVLDKNGKGNSFELAEAILRATDQGFKVINMSLGSDGDSPVVRDAVAYALTRNVVLVAAAGNDAVNRVSYPAAYDGVMAIASVDAGGKHLYFSNRGKAVDVAAPGFSVVADWPGGKRAEVSGTSASTALATGAMAALLSREPNLNGRQAAELMVQYADNTGLPGSAEEIGGGVLNLERVLNRNLRGQVDLAVGGVMLQQDGNQGKLVVGIQNRGTETVNSPTLEITAGADRRNFYFGSLAPGNTATQSMMLDLGRLRQEGGITAGAVVNVRGDQRPSNDLWAGYFRISNQP